MTALNLDAKLMFPDQISLPDSFNLLSNTLPTADFVVSRTHEDVIVSRYGDIVWDFTVYHPEGQPSNLLFAYWDQGGLTPNREKLVDKIKHIFFILILVKR